MDQAMHATQHMYYKDSFKSLYIAETIKVQNDIKLLSQDYFTKMKLKISYINLLNLEKDKNKYLHS